MRKRLFIVLVLVIIIAGCNSASVPAEQTVTSNDSIDCINHYDYVVTKDNIDKPFSAYEIYLSVDSENRDARKKIKLAANLDKSTSANQIVPTFYQWHLVFAQDRNWYVDFLQEPDGFYSTTLELSQAEWRASSLCIFFKDVNNDGNDDNLIFRVIIGDFIDLPPTPEEQISAYLQAIVEQDQSRAIALWQISDTDNAKAVNLKDRREQITQQLLNYQIQPSYSISWQEGWVGGESAYKTTIESAWLARVAVNLSAPTGEHFDYIFDLVNKEYDTVPDFYHQDWVIVDVYPKGEQAYFWAAAPAGF